MPAAPALLSPLHALVWPGAALCRLAVGEIEQVIAGLLGLGRGGQQRARVLSQHPDPAVDVAGMVVDMAIGETELGSYDGLADAGHELFGGVGFRPKPSRQVAVEPVLGA